MEVCIIGEILSSFSVPCPIAVALTILAKFSKIRKSSAASDVSCIQHRMTSGTPKPKTTERTSNKNSMLSTWKNQFHVNSSLLAIPCKFQKPVPAAAIPMRFVVKSMVLGCVCISTCFSFP